MQLGDWLDPSAPPDQPWAARTDRALVATAYHARSARLVARAARVLGHEFVGDRYDRLADRIVNAFNTEYVTPNGRVVSDSPTAYALALRFDLLPPDQHDRAADQLVELPQGRVPDRDWLRGHAADLRRPRRRRPDRSTRAK
jgi:alpha-L-rhamnosidase